eukprot:8288479-Ditylum_brightwellii.AAC.1
MTTAHSREAKNFCSGRKMELLTADTQKHTLIHFQTSEQEYRILNHFYGFEEGKKRGFGADEEG